MTLTAQIVYPKRAEELTEELLAMSPEELQAASRYPLRILPAKKDLYAWLARIMADEIKENNARAKPTRWIIPVGPKGQFPLLAKITNDDETTIRFKYR